MKLSENEISLEEQLAIEKRRVNYYKKQLAYLKEHVDIKTLKPTTGKLRSHQLELLEFAKEFLNEIASLKIKPFLMGGNLIGALRHKGFIPWDDDFDLGLIREDYDKLVQHCKKNYKTIVYEIKISDYINDPFAPGTKWDKSISENPNEFVFFILPDAIQIGKGTSIIDFKVLDFFVLDSFKNDYDFNVHKKYLSEIKSTINKIDYLPEIVKFLDTEKKIFSETQKNGENLYYGIYNMCAYRPQYNKWIPKNLIFPLKKIKFENTNFWIPNKAEEYAEYEVPGYMNFPSDIGIPSHLTDIDNYIKNKKGINFSLTK